MPPVIATNRQDATTMTPAAMLLVIRGEKTIAPTTGHLP